jgi:hypothetical protein
MNVGKVSAEQGEDEYNHSDNHDYVHDLLNILLHRNPAIDAVHQYANDNKQDNEAK